ncbi:MAG TPA: SRPBCC family protein [Haliscomenobacter sp.]|uniref:SRPBCC family protein n=1 Tax=Haliscomenobacter sp. TaxID=2717303 RepID=UPI002C4280A3|nr:SRPBCC family protein [Haliscomenobacter sp.]HOY19599.1 SRPBCC family protein [Haliscomenobacter sp.]
MRILIKILIIVGIIIAIPLIVALFVKKDYVVEREIVINKPKVEVFEYIKFIKNLDNYSIWNKLDPNMKKSYKGTDGTVGFVAAWESKDINVGVGEQEIMKIIENQRIDTKLRYKVPLESEDDDYMITEDAGNNQTKVKWGLKAEIPYPMNFMLLFRDMDKDVGIYLEQGLKNLKSVLEIK